MGEEVQLAGTTARAKIRHPVAVAVLIVVTLGIYAVFWWYFINRELADYGRAKGTDELGDSPLKSTLALFPGGLIIVPLIWTSVTTFRRVQAAQRIAGETSIGFLLYVVFTPAFDAYIQSGLNSVWRAQTQSAE